MVSDIILTLTHSSGGLINLPLQSCQPNWFLMAVEYYQSCAMHTIEINFLCCLLCGLFSVSHHNDDADITMFSNSMKKGKFT